MPSCPRSRLSLFVLLLLAVPFTALGQDSPPAQTLEKVDAILKNPTQADLENADKLLCELGQLTESRRVSAPLTNNPSDKLQSQIAGKLQEVRRQRLLLFTKTAMSESAWTDALRQADAWLAADPSLRDAVRSLWIGYGSIKLKEGDFSKVRLALNHLDDHFSQSSQAEPLRRALHVQAETLAQEAKQLPDDQAIARLEKALTLWPHAPGLRDDLEKLKKNYRVLYVAVRQLPENLSPATAFTNSEIQALDLLFRRMIQVHIGDEAAQHYTPDLMADFPRSDGLHQQIKMRRDAFWSDGERVTSADVRHTAQLLESTSTWRDVLDVPRDEGRPFTLQLAAKQGLLDPLAPLRFYVLPQKFRDQPLTRADDPEIAKAPIGNGPFRYMGRQQESKRTVAVFRVNPYYDRPEKINAVREIRMVAWADLQADKPLPQLVLDVPAKSVAALKKLGYADAHSVPSRRVYFLALNHRVPALANQDLRRALAHAIQRDKILDDYFRGPDVPARLFQPLNGPFPAHSWAYCPPPRVPEELYLLGLAKSFARKASQQLGATRLTLKFPADEPGVKEACTAIASQVSQISDQAQISIELVPLSSQQMRAALDKRDYELAYHHWDFPDNNFWLWPLFDPHPDALKPGGSNFLGYDNDAKLQSMLRAAMIHRFFPVVHEYQQNIHAHLYERMPLIPLWQLPDVYMTHPSLSAPGLDPHQVFLNVLDWKIRPLAK